MLRTPAPTLFTLLIQAPTFATIVDVQGDRVRVGISAPNELRVYRRELWERLEQSDAVDDAALYGEKSGNPKRKA